MWVCSLDLDLGTGCVSDAGDEKRVIDICPECSMLCQLLFDIMLCCGLCTHMYAHTNAFITFHKDTYLNQSQPSA